MTSEQKRYTYATKRIKSTALSRVLDLLRNHYETEGKPVSLVIPYVLTCATYLESKLNDSLAESAEERFGEDVAEGLLSLSMPRKLAALVPVLTQGRYSINKEHWVYQRLATLIRVRNSIVHAKSSPEEFEAKPEDLVRVPVLSGGEGGQQRLYRIR